MMEHWYWIALGTLIMLLLAQQFAMYQIRRESKKREELFQIVTENAADMIALVDLKGNRLYNSPAYKRILGYSAAELGETSAFEQIHPDDRFKVLEAGREARSTGVGKKLEYRIRHKDGTWRSLESVAGTIRDEKGEVTKLVIVNRDITDRKRAEELAEHNSFHDGLTGLPNRRLFLDRLQNLFDRVGRNPERQYAVLFVDLDNFKEFNISAGTAAGDLMIVETGRHLDACLRDEDTVSRSQEHNIARNAVLSRMGGDEFTILLEGVNDPSDAMRVGQRILSAIAEPFLLGGRDVRASASVGIALNTPTHKRAEDVLQDADAAMRRAKALGGSRCEFFDEAMHTRAVHRLTLESQLREAIDKREFRVYYQPIVHLETKQIVGFEALLRWQHPDQGLISPDKFMAAAEDRGLLVFIGQWVLLQACQQLRSWNTVLPWTGHVSMSVNLSSSQLADPGFITGLEATLVRSGIDASRLHLEISESVAAADSKLTASVLASLKRLGLGVTLENFGAGETSLFALRQFPGEALKIDRSLIGALLLDRGAADLVELIILAAQKLKLQVTAEGIESARQLERLHQLGCVLGQGFLFSQPVDAKAAEHLLRQGNFVLHAKQAAP
jgi:diguanylate cyclase (GGDEF)-like protein/PAS domain S-box-containing protein